MDYSVQGYLERRTEDELGGMLRHYIMLEDWDNYGDTIRLILKELRKRELRASESPAPEAAPPAEKS